jgi:hypothetical protein
VPEGPKNTNRANFYTVPNNQTVEDWVDVSRIIRDRMGQINPAEIKKVAVVISVGATNSRAGAEAWVDDLILGVRRLAVYEKYEPKTTQKEHVDGSLIIGTWGGQVREGSQTYPVSMEISQTVLNGPAGKIDYPTLQCGGTLKLRKAESGLFLVEEKIN